MSLLSSSSTLCEVAADICFGCSVVIPEAPFCAFAIQDGKGDAGERELEHTLRPSKRGASAGPGCVTSRSIALARCWRRCGSPIRLGG